MGLSSSVPSHSSLYSLRCTSGPAPLQAHCQVQPNTVQKALCKSLSLEYVGPEGRSGEQCYRTGHGGIQGDPPSTPMPAPAPLFPECGWWRHTAADIGGRILSRLLLHHPRCEPICWEMMLPHWPVAWVLLQQECVHVCACVCVCVHALCVCVFMHVCLYACMCMCAWVYSHMCLCACVHVCVFVCLYVHMYMYVWVCVLLVQGSSTIDRALPSFSCLSLYPTPPHLTTKLYTIFLTIFPSLSFLKLIPLHRQSLPFCAWETQRKTGRQHSAEPWAGKQKAKSLDSRADLERWASEGLKSPNSLIANSMCCYFRSSFMALYSCVKHVLMEFRKSFVMVVSETQWWLLIKYGAHRVGDSRDMFSKLLLKSEPLRKGDWSFLSTYIFLSVYYVDPVQMCFGKLDSTIRWF